MAGSIKNIFWIVLAIIVIISSGIGAILFSMSLSYDDSMFLEFDLLVKYASIAFDVSLTISVGIICFQHVRKKKTWLLVPFYVSVLISMPPRVFIGVVDMSVKAREIRGRQVCLEYQLRDVYNAAKDYAASHDGLLPAAENWSDVLMEFDNSLKPESFVYPKMPHHVIAYNESVAGKRLADLRRNTILFFEAQGGLNLTGSQDLINSLDTETADIILANGYVRKYGVQEKGVRFYNEKLLEGIWE